ncbi:MAG: hypothetical protein QOG63_2384 [Thermoleophilaceae bacterium]|nr:hypothetical protein [Thermoleophilaceae bacterium]
MSAMPSTLELYRDDGVPARMIGGVRIALPPALLELAGTVPLVVFAIVDGTHVSDGALIAAVAFLILMGGLASGRPHLDRLRWAAPPLLRAAEYGATLYLGVHAQPAALALIGVLTFRHYDTVYRLRHQGTGPPAWINLASLGWDGRLILGCVLLAAGALPAGYFALAAIFAVMFAGESVASWRRFGRAQRPESHEEEEDIAE